MSKKEIIHEVTTEEKENKKEMIHEVTTEEKEEVKEIISVFMDLPRYDRAILLSIASAFLTLREYEGRDTATAV